jgi:hypothetical protein
MIVRMMTDDEVLDVLSEFGVETEPPPFPMRMEPSGAEHPGDKVFRFPVPLPDGNYLAVSWMFGYPDPDEMINYKVRWQSVDGPFTRDALEAFGRA